MSKLFTGELQEIIECIEIAQQSENKELNISTAEVLKKIKRMKKEEEDYQLRD